MLARFTKKRRDYPVYPHIILPIGHDEREIAVTLLRNVGHAFREITGHDAAKNAPGKEDQGRFRFRFGRQAAGYGGERH